MSSTVTLWDIAEHLAAALFEGAHFVEEKFEPGHLGDQF
jgi:hypothetical protein